MRRAAVGSLLTILALAACDNDFVIVDDDFPAAPRNLEASYYGGVVTVHWELAPGWDGESFRVYSRRVTDADYFLIAEVTSCAASACVYEDTNVVGGQTYEYYVAAFDPFSLLETASSYSVEVFVPNAVPPPAPNQMRVVALDDANYLSWGQAARSASDFAFYRVYQAGSSEDFLLGETDSEGFLDLLAVNGDTYAYFVTAVDTDGHEGDPSGVAEGTPRPDFHGEWLYGYFDRPALSGFRFQPSENTDPVMNGASSDRHFRLETDVDGWWLVPGPGTAIYPTGFATTSLKCQVAADAGCTDVTVAPSSGYTTNDVWLETQTSYVLRVIGDDGATHYAVLRVELLGYDQNDDALMIFDWAYQTQAGNPNLAIVSGG